MSIGRKRPTRRVEDTYEASFEHDDFGLVAMVVELVHRPVWTVESPAEGPLRLREESGVCVAGLRGRDGTVRELTTEGGVRRLIVDIDGWKKARPEEGAPAAHDAKALECQEVVLLTSGVVGLSRKKSFSVWDGNGPGAWLTHAAPRPETSGRKTPPGTLVTLVETLGGR